MKKTLSLVLTCLLALTITIGAQAAPFYMEDMGITLNVPEGMTVEDISTEEAILLSITVDEDANLKYAFTISYIEEFDGKNIADLTEEEGNILTQGIADALTDPQFNAVETEVLDLLVVVSGDGTQLHYVTLLGGWLFDSVVGRADGPLTDTDLQTAADLLMTMEFDEE